MLDHLIGIDQALFYFINVGLANPVTDFLMPLITSDTLLRIIYGAAVAVLLWRGDRRLRWLVLFSAAVLLMSDQLSSQVLKPWLERPRPCQVLSQVHLLVMCGAGFAMPSSHAANLFGQAALFAYHVKATRWYLLPFAILVAVSRIFVGVHYPFDVLVGTLLGCLTGGLGAVAFWKFEKWRW
jgi:undecaprenyl-diphosphatase